MTRQASLEGADIRSDPERYPFYNFNTPIEGAVVGIHYPKVKDPLNRSDTEIEYDVDPTSCNLRRLNHCVRADLQQGLDDTEDRILRVASNPVQDGQTINKDGGDSTTPFTPRFDMDGDRVLLIFVNGNINRPVIVGVLKHPKSKVDVKDVRGKTLLDGDKLIERSRHRGTEVVHDEKGNVRVDFGPDPKSKKEEKTGTLHIGDLDVVVDSTKSPTEVRIANKDGGEMIITVTKNDFKVKVPGTASIECKDAVVTASNDAKVTASNNAEVKGKTCKVTGESQVDVKATGAGANVNVDCGSAGKINLGGAAAAMTVALETDMAGPYPIVCKGQAVKAKVGP